MIERPDAGFGRSRRGRINRLAFIVLSLAGPAFGGLTYTCDPAVAASTCDYLNSTIAGLYNSTFGNIDANIYVQFGQTGLGQSSYFLNFITYSQYVAALTAAAQSSGDPVQASAVRAINSLDTSVYGNYTVEITSPLGKEFQIPGMAGSTAAGDYCSNPGTAPCFDGVVTISNSQPMYYRQGAEAGNAYDFYSVVEHETDEILGTASCIDTTGHSLSNGCIVPGVSEVLSAVDLFRYQSNGNLVLISTTPGGYFSYDGGQTNGAGTYKKVYNTAANGLDYADFLSSNPCRTQQSIQDAQGCPGEDAGLDITNDGGAEIDILKAIGFTPASQTVKTPAISNVLNGATGKTTMAASTYVAIYGTNLSTDATGRTWTAADFTKNANGTLNMPTALDGTSVNFGGSPAYIYYVSAMQLNIITPANTAIGSGIPVVVSVNGQVSASFSATLQNLAPAFFAWYPGTADNGKYLVATHLNGTNVGKLNLFPSAGPNFTTPATPGETIEVYGTGFGPTSPPIAAGIETDKVYNLSPTPTATVGGLPAAVAFAGLIPPESQLYQVDVKIPGNAPNGDLALVVTTDGVNSYSGLITVQAP